MNLFPYGHYLKSPLLLIVYASLSYSVFAQPRQKFHLTGKLEGNSIKTVTLIYRDADGEPITATDSLSNGTFRFSGFIDAPTEARLRCNITARDADSRDNNYVPIFFIEPVKMKMEIKEGHFKSFRLTGSKTQNEYMSLEIAKAAVYKQQAPFLSQLYKLNDSLGMALKAKDTVRMYEVQEGRQRIFAQLKPYHHIIAETDIQFAANHPDSYLSTYLLNGALATHSPDTIKFYFLQLTPPVQHSYYGEKIQNTLGLKEVLPAGSTFPDMAGTDITGQKTTLHSLIGPKYTLIIFWASWCVPCRKHAPEYKRIYNQYKSQGLQVITITEDSDKKAWLSAIKNDGTQDLTHFFPDDIKTLSRLCGIRSIPAEILLSNNKVIAQFEGAYYKYWDLDALNQKLQQLFAPASSPSFTGK